MATAAVVLQGNALQSVANGAWSGRSGCSPQSDLFKSFIRETPDYKAAISAGQSDDDALQHLGADRTFLSWEAGLKAVGLEE